MDGQLLRFNVENHRSLRDEQELSFIASAPDDSRLIRPDAIDEAVLPVVALYGANASGKSNVFDAIGFAQRAIVFSQRVWEPTAGIAREPFSLGASRNAASEYVFDLAISGVRYQYGFAVDDVAVVEEWLHSWPYGRKQELFNRDRGNFEFNRNLHGENRAIESLTRPNSLFLSAAAQNNHEQLRSLHAWFALRLRVDPLSVPSSLPSRHPPWWSQFIEGNLPESTAQRQRVRALLAAADLGIEDFRVEQEAPQEPTRPTLRGRARPRWRLSFAHQHAHLPADSAARAWLDFEQESRGTQALVRLLPHILEILESGGLLIVDELDVLHPMLALALIQLFHDPQRNPRGAQLLFNTHDSSLLGNVLADPPPLRRDQVWLTEKDKDGASHLYPLTDYKPRTSENLERGYLQGRYGAVPFLGGFESIH